MDDKAAGIQRRGKSKANKPAAKNDYIGPVHGPLTLVVAYPRGKPCPGVRRQAQWKAEVKSRGN